MKKKLVLWGSNAQDEKVLIGLELVPSDKLVNIYTIKEEEVNKDFNDLLFKKWRDQEEIGFPHDAAAKQVRPLTVSETILPDDLRTDNTELINRAQTEWHFVVLSTKLHESYQQELEMVREKVLRLDNYDTNVWDELKSFWNKVQHQIREKNLYREHGQELKVQVNSLFTDLKKLRKRADDAFKEESQDRKRGYLESLKVFQEKAEKGIRLDGIFNELKDVQRDFKQAKLTRKDRNEVWDVLDGLFKQIKEKRYGGAEANKKGNSPLERLQRRMEGLDKAINRMKNSINKDENDLKYHSNKDSGFAGQLEKQLKEAKIKMIEERVNSKKEKYEDMLNTKKSLEKKMANIEEKEKLAKLKEQAKQEAAAKIKAEIKESQKEMEENGEALTRAAKVISDSKRKKATRPDQDEDSLSPGQAGMIAAHVVQSINEEQ